MGAISSECISAHENASRARGGGYLGHIILTLTVSVGSLEKKEVYGVTSYGLFALVFPNEASSP